ncbi:unnamed protein product, partial [Musa acuminata var. zebrina]
MTSRTAVQLRRHLLPHLRRLCCRCARLSPVAGSPRPLLHPHCHCHIDRVWAYGGNGLVRRHNGGSYDALLTIEDVTLGVEILHHDCLNIMISSFEQPSAAGTPRLLGPSIKVWDPCNVLLLPPPPPLALFARGAASATADRVTEVLLIAHGECAASVRPDLVGGRWAAVAGLTPNGERQARALAVFLKSQGVRFDEVYSSPLDRARATAAFVCR